MWNTDTWELGFNLIQTTSCSIYYRLRYGTARRRTPRPSVTMEGEILTCNHGASGSNRYCLQQTALAPTDKMCTSYLSPTVLLIQLIECCHGYSQWNRLIGGNGADNFPKDHHLRIHLCLQLSKPPLVQRDLLAPRTLVSPAPVRSEITPFEWVD